ncbi:MAG TPA: ATP-binding protein, partial [Kofleriaceae bacterium]|nr:ATP-binding protein [Kofleriaceae bacterium]
MMRITRIRLVNFHNFIDETIEVSDGGHLFLLGDNGSGKTTVLDAVHYVLSGAQLELNAAARMGGRKDEGRSIQGVVLRHDFERGVRNEGGAVAYAAIEVADPERDQRLTLGVGIEATTLEARVTKWGFVSARPLADIPLVVGRDGGRHAATREGLAAALGPAEVFLRIGDYRAAVAARLFAGPERYREAAQFWSMAKAYREIVAGARDFGGLFRRLLPPPDPRVFGEIIRSLHKVAEMEDALGELDAQRAYVAGLIGLADEVANQREAGCRYQWLGAHREREATSAELGASRARSVELEERRDQLGGALETAEAQLGEADGAVRSAQAEDAEGVAEKLADTERRSRVVRAEALAAVRDAGATTLAAAGAERAEQEAVALLAAETDRAVG